MDNNPPPGEGFVTLPETEYKNLQEDLACVTAENKALQKAETWMATFAGTVGNPAGPLAADLAEVRELLRKTTSS